MFYGKVKIKCYKVIKMEMEKQKPVFSGRKACSFTRANTICWHDYKNAIQVGNVDYVCPLCKELIDPLEGFFMNSFEFVDVSGKTGK